MRNLILWCVSLALTSSTAVKGQDQVENRNLSICYRKTTSVIFPFSITSVDRGSIDVLVQKAKGVENVLQVKAGKKDFSETNLTVITADGALYQFTVSYNDSPASQAIRIESPAPKAPLILAKDVRNEYHLQSDSKHLLGQSRRRNVERDNKHHVTLALQHVFVRDNILYFRIAIRNKSAIDYDIKSLKFLIKDKIRVKRTSSQEREVVPLYIGNQTNNIKGYASAVMIYAVQKFTIPDGKILHINLFEENGGRNLALKVTNQDILKARTPPATESLLTIN